jgi:hypothetical protein
MYTYDTADFSESTRMLVYIFETSRYTTIHRRTPGEVASSTCVEVASTYALVCSETVSRFDQSTGDV